MFKTKKGFTLVELSISLVIIGIISGIGVLSIVQTLADQRRIVEADQNLNSYSNAILQKIGDGAVKIMPDNNTAMSVIPATLHESFQFRADNDTTGKDVCTLAKTSCTVTSCEDKDCIEKKSVRDVLFTLVELGINKAYNSGSTNWCDVEYNSFAEGYDDKINFYTLIEAKRALGCDVNSDRFKFITDSLPTFDRNASAIGQQVKIEVTPMPGITEYFWCIDTDDRSMVGVDNYATFRDNDGTDRPPMVMYTWGAYRPCSEDKEYHEMFTTKEPFIYLNSRGADFSNMMKGVYSFAIKAFYEDNVTKERKGAIKLFTLTIR